MPLIDAGVGHAAQRGGQRVRRAIQIGEVDPGDALKNRAREDVLDPRQLRGREVVVIDRVIVEAAAVQDSVAADSSM